MKRKRIMTFLLVGFLLLFSPILIITKNDSNYQKRLKKEIEKNTSINKISYINKYDSYYIVMDNKKVHIIDKSYQEVDSTSLDKIHKNSKNYDLIYEDNKLKYMKVVKNKQGTYFYYYDIFTYEIIDKIAFDNK